MRQALLKDGLGRWTGSLDSDFGYWDEQESYRDLKVDEVRFPKHNHKQPSPVQIYHISELDLNIK